ncbi:MAG: leucine-rich repeat domain-containing protein, partial [Lachnospiraceae bacterium]|nr:leucine-rich repeat domain-containing protein [Lachnospiraceae bacterium]
MAKSAAAKSAAKKKNRKLKRQIRKTVGALLMVSAIAVAAVPVPDVSANLADNTVIKVAVTDSRESTNVFNGATAGYESEIPLATGTTPIYTSGEGMYQFAYIDEVAVILQYNGGYLEGNSVVIPDTIEGYKKYTDNTTRNDFCLVTKDGSFLAYRTQEQKIDANQQRVYTVPDIIDPNTNAQLVVVQNQLVPDPNGSGDFVYRETVTVPNPDPSGSPSTEYKYHKVSPVMEWKYNPCYYADRDKEGGWGTLKDAQLYWENRSVTPFEYQPAGGTDSKQRINADVAYLGVQTVEKDPATGSWELGDYITDPADGVFAGESNIVSVQMSENIRGIGDYAFYNCRNLEKVILNNGLQSIGNGVFAGCINIVECNIDVTARIRVIGKDAFYGCAALKSFTVPVAIEALGDSCFEGCTGLESIDFSGGGKNLALEKLGYHLFQGCSSLGAVEFPSTYRENDIDIDMFKG